MINQSYDFYHGLCLNNVLQVWLIGNQRYQVPPFRYINRDDEVSCLVRVMKVIGHMIYLMRFDSLSWSYFVRDLYKIRGYIIVKLNMEQD